MSILKKGNNNTKRLAYMALVRLILEYGVVCWDPNREGQVSALNRVQKREAKFANNINEMVWETLARTDSPNTCPFQGIHQGTGLENDRG
jgi:hypothetical protein